MRFTTTDLPGVIVIEPDVYRDARGFFLETYNSRKYREGGVPDSFVQDNHSRSVQGTVRGLHAQRNHPQGTLVRVIEGEIFDVAVDVRRGSPHFGRWVGVTLSAANARQCYIPPGFAHGFCVTAEVAQVECKCTDFYDPLSEITLMWNDPQVGISWPIDLPLLSNKDRAGLLLRELDCWLPVYEEAA